MSFGIPDALSPDLSALVQSRQAVNQELQQHQDLLQRLQDLSSSAESHGADQVLTVDYDLGQYSDSGFTCQAVISDASKIQLAMGVEDLVVELSVDRALIHCQKKIAFLTKKHDTYLSREEGLRKDLQLITETLRKALRNPANSAA